MNNYNDLRLYLVADGEVTPATVDTEWDGSYSILVAATSPENALKVAAAFDREEAAPDNLAWDGDTIVVVTLCHPETGLYF